MHGEKAGTKTRHTEKKKCGGASRLSALGRSLAHDGGEREGIERNARLLACARMRQAEALVEG